MKKLILTCAVGMVLFSNVSMAGDCAIKITRTACPGKETEAFKPYDGKKTTEEKKSFGSADECKAWATKSSLIVRKGTLSQKSVEATFDGTAVGDKPFVGDSKCE